MLGVRLQRTRLELRSHRRWLNGFVARVQVNAPSAFDDRPPFARNHARSYTNRTGPAQGLRSKTPKSEEKRGTIKRLKPMVPAAMNNKPDLAEAIRKYLRSPTSKFTNDWFRRAAQALHAHGSRLKSDSEDPKGRQERDQHVEFAEMMVQDLQKGRAEPSTGAVILLLQFFNLVGARESGVRFWHWVEPQDENHVNAATYGAAIELLAYNGAKSEEMETLYQQALDRFPGDFAAYHLSHNAILPDRERATEIKGVSTKLLHGIMIARLLRGDTRNAYLAIDTHFRLFPDLMAQDIIFDVNNERPLVESYALFAMSCRNGIRSSGGFLKSLGSKIRTSCQTAVLKSVIGAQRAMLAAWYLHIGTGGNVPKNALNESAILVTQILRTEEVRAMNDADTQEVVQKVLSILRKIFEICARSGTMPGPAVFNSIIVRVAGAQKSRHIIDTVLADMRSLGVPRTGVTRRSVLSVAGVNGDREYVEGVWADIVSSCQKEGKTPGRNDLQVLIKSARQADHLGFARQEVEMWQSHLEEYDREQLQERLDNTNPPTPPEEVTTYPDVPSVLAKIDTIAADLAMIDAQTQGGPVIQDFNFSLKDKPLPMTLLAPAHDICMPEEEMRKLYDEVTMELQASEAPVAAAEDGDAVSATEHAARDENEGEASSQMTSEDEPALATEGEGEGDDQPPRRRLKISALSPTNIPFDTLRYESWKTLNYLLDLSTRSDSAYHEAVDKAIAEGIAPPVRSHGFDFGDADVRRFGLSDLANAAEGEAAHDVDHVEKARKRILELRGISN